MATNNNQNQLGKALWAVANELRGAMMADDFRDYMLSFLFWKYLSDNYLKAAKKELGSDYPAEVKNDSENEVVCIPLQMWYNANMDDAFLFEQQMRRKIHYVIEPQYLWDNVVGLARTQSGDLLKTLQDGFKYIENESFESSFKGLFSEINLNSEKLGKSYTERNVLLCKVIKTIANKLAELSVDSDDLGDAYEYLIGQFAAGSGQKAGEFYTPQMVSSILSKIVTLDCQDPNSGKKSKIDKVLDFACGSGSLLLNVRKEMGSNGIGKIYGQEKNITTYNLARMNMLLHGVKDTEFEIHHGDTLVNDWGMLNEENPAKKMIFDAIVANPPFSLRWDPKEETAKDFRFNGFGVAPKSAADFAFLLHGLHFLSDSGTMAIILPHGVLFRGGKEEVIRKELIKKDYIDAIIGLPANLFYSTGIPVCIIVLKKCRKNDKILFINASSEEHYEKGKRQNYLREEDVEKIIKAYKSRAAISRYAREVSLSEIKENGYNLNITRYVNLSKDEEAINLSDIQKKLADIEKKIIASRNEHNKFLRELGLKEICRTMEAFIDEAKQYIQRPIQDKRDAFLRLCSLNLLNATIKKKEFKDSLSYGYIKPCVSRFVEYVITHTDDSYVDEMYYNSEQKCMYIRCYGVQFSFHNIIITESISAFVDSKSNIPVQWDGVKLQLIAQDLFLLAKDLHSGNIEENQINELFNHIIESK